MNLLNSYSENFLPDELGIFIGYSDDASEEVQAIKELELVLQSDFRLYRKLKPEIKYSSLKFWEWRDAHCGVGGQDVLVNPAIRQAAIAIFVFKDRVGAVTWKEINDCRRKKKHILAFFSKAPSNNRKFGKIEYMKKWVELLEKKKMLIDDWTKKKSMAIKIIDDYNDISHLKNIAFVNLKNEIIEFLIS